MPPPPIDTPPAPSVIIDIERGGKMKRVYCLYRVSTMEQVEKDDIPMQRIACREFAETKGWDIVNEFVEKGVSGFKVSADDREAMQKIKKDAVLKKFDILLVFMFDRLGRRDDETPFVVEWFVKNGIAVWSVIEGEQRFENHVDKLMNYIRYWQAQGESEKTSVCVKTAHAQLTMSGHFRGGAVPFGYRLEHKGRINKKGAPVGDYVIHEQEAMVVKIIFDRYVNHGYGTQRICSYLAGIGLSSRTGGWFTNTTIQNMIKRTLYVGILSSGGVQSDTIPELQIVSQTTFDRAQEIAKERASNYADRRIPLNTKGNALLSGNIFCGHCGARLTLTANGKKYILNNGDVTVTPRTRYVCYNMTRHPGKCDGQTGYTTKKLDSIIENIMLSIFSKIKKNPSEKLIAAQYEERITSIKLELEQAKAELGETVCDLTILESELLKVIQGTSVIKPALLSLKHDELECSIGEKRAVVNSLEQKLSDNDAIMHQVAQRYNDVLTWANIYADISMDVKKMIVVQFINAIRVSANYEIEIDFKISERELGLDQAQTAGKRPRGRSRKSVPDL